MSWNIFFLDLFAVLVVVILTLSVILRQGNTRWRILAAGLAALAAASMLLEGAARVICLDGAALLGVALVWNAGTAPARKAARTYFFLLLAAVVLIAANLLIAPGDHPQPLPAPLDKLVVFLLAAGFGLKLALVPFYFWLPAVAETTPALTSALIIGIADIAAFTELVTLRESLPWVFTQYAPLWIGLALLSMFVGALLALAQRDLKRMLAFSTIDDMGYLLLGIVAGTDSSLAGALVGAASHAAFKVALFGAVAAVEARLQHNLTFEDRGLAARFPISAAVFIVGALGMIGVPPTLGFAGRWRLYQAGLALGGPALVVAMAAATVLALLYYVRAIHTIWLGQPAENVPAVGEVRPAGWILAGLCTLLLIAGAYPGLWLPFFVR
jgi:multicomponent Na+:H+ antiporter subunit D